MGNENFLEKLASQFGQNASVKNVYGEPIHAGDKTIIPVAEIAYGLGGGYGHGKNKLQQRKEDSDANGNIGEGAGAGGGMYARAKGVYEVTGDSTRFIPASAARILIIGFVAGFIIKGLFFTHKRKS